MKKMIFVFAMLSVWFSGCMDQNSSDETTKLRTQDEPKKLALEEAHKADEDMSRKLLDELKSEFDTKLVVFESAIEAAETDAKKRELFDSNNPVGEYLDQLNQHAAYFDGTKAGFDAALEAVARSNGANKSSAMSLLIKKYAARLDYQKVIGSLLEDLPSEDIEQWIQLLVSHAPGMEQKAHAMLGLARYVDQIPAFRDGFVKNPHLMAKLPESHQLYLQRERTEEENETVEKFLQQVIEDFPEGHYRRGKSFGEFAESALFEMQNLKIGQLVPDILGKDLDGVEFRLSDYRGKVVMLDFWGHWCGPCRQMYDHEREMNAKLASAPFALIGLNSDGDLEFARDAVESEGLTWRHFWNGPKGMAGPLASKWNVEAWPTIYLIDGNGVIRYKDVRGEDLDRALEGLLSEMGHSVTLLP